LRPGLRVLADRHRQRNRRRVGHSPRPPRPLHVSVQGPRGSSRCFVVHTTASTPSKLRLRGAWRQLRRFRGGSAWPWLPSRDSRLVQGCPCSSPRRVGSTDAPVRLPPQALAWVRVPLRRSFHGSRRFRLPGPSTPGASLRRPPSDRPWPVPSVQRRWRRVLPTRALAGVWWCSPAGSCSAFALWLAP